MTLSTFEVKLDPSSLSTMPSGMVVGSLHVVLDGTPFPETAWNDFAATILGWWCRALLDASRRDFAGAALPFMDGPYQINVGPPDALGATRVELCHRGRPVLHVGRVTISTLRSEVLGAARAILDFADSSNVAHADIDALRLVVEELAGDDGEDS